MTKEIILPSGKKATLKKGKGYDLLQAQTKAKTSILRSTPIANHRNGGSCS